MQLTDFKRMINLRQKLSNKIVKNAILLSEAPA